MFWKLVCKNIKKKLFEENVHWDYGRSVLDWISPSAQSLLSLLNVPFIL